MRGAGFVAHEDVADAVVGEQLVIDRQDRAAGIAENEFDILPLEAFDQDCSAAALGIHTNLRPVSGACKTQIDPALGSIAPGRQAPNRGLELRGQPLS